jgi:DNA helicase HerA-like ATPase
MDTTLTHVKEHIGIVTNDASTTQITFLITPLKNKTTVEKTDYITLDHPTHGDTCAIIAEVTEIKSYEESIGTTLGDKNAGNLIATANIIGYINIQEQNRPIHKLLTPPNPGSRIYLPYAEFLEDTFTRDNNGKPYAIPIRIGTMEAAATTKENKKPLDYYLNAESLTTTHTLITGTDGTGKTHLTTILTTEITNKTQTPIVIIDPYGEYHKIREKTKKPIQLITPNPDENPKDKLKNTIKPNQTTILNAESLTPEEKQKTLTQCLAVLWKARLEKTVPPFLLVIENAETLKNETLETIAYQGTKHGIALILIAKHPTELGAKILSQTSTQIMGRTTDKDDLDYLKNLAQEKTPLLPQLKQGQWIINTPDHTQPTQIHAN